MGGPGPPGHCRPQTLHPRDLKWNEDLKFDNNVKKVLFVSYTANKMGWAKTQSLIVK